MISCLFCGGYRNQVFMHIKGLPMCSPGCAKGFIEFLLKSKGGI